MEDETLDETASGEEQPVQEAVAQETQEVVPAASETESEASAESEQPSATTRAWAGKYQSPEELERAYLEAQREASRMAGELSAFKKTGASPTLSQTEPKWKQLDTERNKWAQQLRNPDLTDQQRWQADEQVRLYDREIAYERAKYDIGQQSTRQSAEQELLSESQQVLSQYAPDLNNMSSPLYQAAAKRYESLIRAGYPDSDTTKALAVTYAASVTNTSVSKAVQQDRGKLLKTLNANVKKAVVAGAGGPTATTKRTVGAEDIDKMSDKEFAEYERRLMGV